MEPTVSGQRHRALGKAATRGGYGGPVGRAAASPGGQRRRRTSPLESGRLERTQRLRRQRAPVCTKQEAPVLRRHTPGKAGPSCVPGGGEAPRVWLRGSQARVTPSGREPSIQSPRETGLLPAFCSVSLFNWSLVSIQG